MEQVLKQIPNTKERMHYAKTVVMQIKTRKQASKNQQNGRDLYISFNTKLE